MRFWLTQCICIPRRIRCPTLSCAARHFCVRFRRKCPPCRRKCPTWFPSSDGMSHWTHLKNRQCRGPSHSLSRISYSLWGSYSAVECSSPCSLGPKWMSSDPREPVARCSVSLAAQTTNRGSKSSRLPLGRQTWSHDRKTSHRALFGKVAPLSCPAFPKYWQWTRNLFDYRERSSRGSWSLFGFLSSIQ